MVNAGSGTTPTIMDGGLVAIADNADPMNIVVYRTTKKLKKGEKRKVCEQPVFGMGASATENSLMTAGRSLVVENNYGYQDPFGPNTGMVTEAGFARVDMNKKLTKCKLVWTNRDARAPSVVPKLSTEDRTDLRLHPPARRRGPGLLLDRDLVRDRQDPVVEVLGLGPVVQQQLRGPRARPRRQRLPRRHRRDREAQRRQLTGASQHHAGNDPHMEQTEPVARERRRLLDVRERIEELETRSASGGKDGYPDARGAKALVREQFRRTASERHPDSREPNA